MATESVHDTFTIERTLRACRAHVFAAWRLPELKRRWFVEQEGPGASGGDYALDFRVGGWETSRFELREGPGAGEHRKQAVFLEIVDEERIVYAYTMAMNGRVHSASLVTVAFSDDSGGTRMVFTEQGAYFPPSDGVTGRRHGWEALLDRLQQAVE